MKAITSYCEISQNANDKSVKAGINEPCVYKKDILKYFKNHDADIAVACTAVDHVTGKNIGSESILSYNDGVYYWTNEEIYLFEKYDLKLNNDFIFHVLRKLSVSGEQ